ncbi:ABC transporter substrate-binding protein [Actinomadura sp. SCN-SB]|uniref:ABC transporter substrate-binding protein n=1 Tax=Actinomadura sp. SCN-SB TaxID=3373092 RepID=UPI003750F59A
MVQFAVKAPVARTGVALVVALSLAACGGSPTQKGAGSGEDRDPYAAVLGQLKGLEGNARTQKLLELARKEDKLNVYTSNTDLADQAKKFTEKYGIQVSVYRAKANQVLQRLLQETKARRSSADLYDSNAEELATANTEGLLRPYEGPADDGLVPAAKQKGWVGSRLNMFTVSWNTKVVKEPPKSFEDLADKRFAGVTIMESRAFEWYMALSQYFVGKGKTQAQVDDLFRRIAANSTSVEGNTTHAQFLGSGEHGLSTSVYNHLVDQLIETGAPLSRTPVVEPLVIRPNGVALLRNAKNPASALLFMEWVLGDGQQLMIGEHRIPARADLQKGALDGVETVTVDIDKLVAEGEQWEARYEDILRSARSAK